jgi:N-acetylmuramic acid 6-phosphate etherase
MIDMQLSNQKLINRGTLMVMNSLGITKNKALILLKKHKSVRKAIKNYNNGI